MSLKKKQNVSIHGGVASLMRIRDEMIRLLSYKTIKFLDGDSVHLTIRSVDAKKWIVNEQFSFKFCQYSFYHIKSTAHGTFLADNFCLKLDRLFDVLKTNLRNLKNT